jgi:hypothetical protein
MGYRLNATVEAAIYSWVKKVAQEYDASITVLWARQKMPEGKANKVSKPFITLQVLEPPQPIGVNSNRKFHKSGAVFTRRKDYIFNVQVDIYPDSDLVDFDLCAYFSGRIPFESTLSELGSANLAIRNMSNLTDLTDLISNGYENRAMFELQFGWFRDLDEDIGYIEDAEGTGTFKDIEGNETDYDWST